MPPPPFEQLDLAKHQDIHTIAAIPPNIVQYMSTPQWSSYHNELETSLITIICIQSQDSPPTKEEEELGSPKEARVNGASIHKTSLATP
jgi:hypothetical protein